MLKENTKLLAKVVVGIDALIICAAFTVAHNLTVDANMETADGVSLLAGYKSLLLCIIPLWILLLGRCGIYRSMRSKSFLTLFWSIFEASLAAVLAFSIAAFFFRFELLSRSFVLAFFVTATSFLSLEKLLVLQALRNVRLMGHNFRVLLIVGSGPRGRKFAQNIEAHPEWGQNILGFIDEKEMLGKTVGSASVIGTFEDLGRILEENVVDEVVFIMPRKWLSRLEEYVRECEKIGVKATIAVDFFDTAIAKPVIADMDGWPLLTFDTTPQDYLSLSLKRVLDFVGAALGVILLSPLFLVVALIIKVTSPGPVFFRQIRCGVNGRTFEILKFRTMIVDAEKKLAALQKLNELEGPVFKIRNDPRITTIGRFLRKTSLDELPQLFNVVMGDMSLVGPRPPIPSEVERYERWQRRRLSMRPGITCIHEVVARNNKDFNIWMRMDLEYIDNWYLGLDLKILARTVLAVVKGTGC